jgi:hypothetical protein
MQHRTSAFRGRALAAACLASLLASSCSPRETSLRREQLFTLGYGPAEDQIDLFQLGNALPQKSCIAMREGIFYVSNGNGAKVTRFSSFGDVLSMIYDPERNPEPHLLAPPVAEGADSAAGRRAIPYPFRSIGEVAVDSRQCLYVEDRLPAERRVQDKDSSALLDHIILRFDKDGKYLDYLGQEGIGGTPFPYISGIFATSSDDCVVVSMTQSAWLAHWFDSSGSVMASVKLSRDALPVPDKGGATISSLDRIVPDPESRSLILKVDYYKESVDPATKSGSGIEFVSSWAFRMDPRDGSYPERWQVPTEERVSKTGSEGASIRYVQIPQFIGAAGKYLFFMGADDGGLTYVTSLDRTTRDARRFQIDIGEDESYFDAFFISREGILCALLGTKFEARFVWWRFDKVLTGLTAGFSR